MSLYSSIKIIIVVVYFVGMFFFYRKGQNLLPNIFWGVHLGILQELVSFSQNSTMKKGYFNLEKICEILTPFAQAQCPHLPTTFTPVATGALWPVVWSWSRYQQCREGQDG